MSFSLSLSPLVREKRRRSAALEEVFAAAPPFLFVAGHEHTLEVLKGALCPTCSSVAPDTTATAHR